MAENRGLNLNFGLTNEQAMQAVAEFRATTKATFQAIVADASAAWKGVSDVTRQALNQQIQEAAGFRKGVADQAREAAREQEKSERALTAVLKQTGKERAEDSKRIVEEQASAQRKALKEILTAQASLNKELNAFEREAAADSRRLAKERQQYVNQLTKEALGLKKDAEKERIALAKHTAAEETRLEKESQAIFSFIQKQETADAKDAARLKAEAEKRAFTEWKGIMDVRHRFAMQSWAEQQKEQRGVELSLKSVASALGFVGSGMTAVALGKKIFSDLSEGAIEAHSQLAKYASEFLKLRDNARELAGVMNNKADNKFTLEQLKFGAMTGQTGEEVKAFRTSFQGEAQQFKDRFAPGEFEKYERAVGRLQVKEGLEAADAGRMGAQTIRTTKGDKLTAEQVMKPLAESFNVLKEGSGDNPILSRQLSRIIATNVGEDGQLFKSQTEAAANLRVQAQYNSEDAAMHLENIQSGLSDLDEGEKAALGIRDEMTFNQKMKAVHDAMKASGKDQDTFLKQAGFKNIRTRRALKTASNEGIDKGVAAKAFKDADKFNLGSYQAQTEDFFKDPNQAGSLRISEAKTALREGQLAQNKVGLATLMEDAKRRALPFETSESGQLSRRLASWATPEGWMPGTGYKDMPEVQRYGHAVEIAEDRARKAGVSLSGSMSDPTSYGTRQFVSEGKSATEAYLLKLIEATERNTKAIEDGNKQRANQLHAQREPPRPPLKDPIPPTPRVRAGWIIITALTMAQHLVTVV